MKVIKKVFEKISGQKIFSPQISRKKIFNRKIFTYKPGTIQATLMIAFSVVSAVILLCMGSVMYLRFSSMSQKEILENNQRLMDQTVESVEDYLINMRQASGCKLLLHQGHARSGVLAKRPAQFSVNR